MDLREKPEVSIITLPTASRTSDTRPEPAETQDIEATGIGKRSLLYEAALSSHHAGARPDTCDADPARFLCAFGLASPRARQQQRCVAREH